MRYAIAVSVCVLGTVVVGCGGGGGGAAGPAAPSYPSIGGAWTGTLPGTSAGSSVQARVLITQSTETIEGSLERISGTWSATATAWSPTGNFNGGVDRGGRAQFTLMTSNTECNLFLDVRLTGSVLSGTFTTVGPNGCVPIPVPSSGSVTLSRE